MRLEELCPMDYEQLYRQARADSDGHARRAARLQTALDEERRVATLALAERDALRALLAEVSARIDAKLK